MNINFDGISHLTEVFNNSQKNNQIEVNSKKAYLALTVIMYAVIGKYD